MRLQNYAAAALLSLVALLSSPSFAQATGYDRILATFSGSSPQVVWSGMPDAGYGTLVVEGQILLEAVPLLGGGGFAYVAVPDDPLTEITYAIAGYVYRLSELNNFYFYDACCFDSAHIYPSSFILLLEEARWAATATRPSFVVGHDGTYFLHDEGPNLYYGQFGDMTITDLRNPDAVPEPEAWLLLIVGFGVLGIRIRRSRQRSFCAGLS